MVSSVNKDGLYGLLGYHVIIIIEILNLAGILNNISGLLNINKFVERCKISGY